MGRGYIILLVTLLLCRLCYGQDKMVVQFTDAATGAVPGSVTLLNKAGSVMAHTDSAGKAVLQLSWLSNGAYVVALCHGYRPDTMRSPAGTVYMQPLALSLDEAVVKGNRLGKLLHEPDEYVVDYDFDHENLIVATYSGNSGGNARLFLLGADGRRLATCAVPSEPMCLYTSCLGVHYCVCYDRFYRLDIQGDSISLRAPYDIKLLAGLMQCEQCLDGNMYYRLRDRLNFRTEYGMIPRGDSVFRRMSVFEEKNVARASIEEWGEIQYLLSLGKFTEAAKMQTRRLMWDKGSYAHIDMPLITRHDTVVIFDYFNKRLLLYNIKGAPVGQVPVRFAWKDFQQFRIIKDAIADKVYLHRYDRQSDQEIEELDISTGTLSAHKIIIKKPFVECVRVYGGDVYFLWQDGRNGGHTATICAGRITCRSMQSSACSCKKQCPATSRALEIV